MGLFNPYRHRRKPSDNFRILSAPTSKNRHFALFISEIVTTALAIFGVMDYKSTWPISKWAFYIGSAIGIMQFIRSPGSVLRDTADIVTSIGDGDKPKGEDEPKDDGDGHGFPCCDNCRWNQDRGSYTVRCFQDSSRNKVANEKCGQWQHY